VPERVEELAPEQAPSAPAQTVAPEAPTATGALPGGMSVQQMLSMQQGAGNAAVSSFVNAQRDGGGSAAPTGRPKSAPGDDRIMSALAGAASRGFGGRNGGATFGRPLTNGNGGRTAAGPVTNGNGGAAAGPVGAGESAVSTALANGATPAVA